MGVCAWSTAPREMSVSISRATSGDVPAVVALERIAFTDPWSFRSFRDALDHAGVYFACAWSADRNVIGYVVAWFVAGEGEIANLAVAPTAWGAGIGRSLIDAALDEGTRRGASAVFLEVRDSNERARRLYRSRGFVEMGRRRDYYRRPDEDAVVLRRMLDAHHK